MQSIEEQKIYNNIITKTGYLTNITYLLVHIGYLIFFLINNVLFMVYVNIISAVIYLLFFLLIRFKKYTIYVIGCGIEISTYMVIGSITCGFNACFQFCLAGLCIIAFFTAYFSRVKSVIKLTIIFCILMCIEYLFTILYSRYNEPVYKLDSPIITTLAIFHTVIVFIFITVYLYIFTKYALNLEERIRRESRIDRLTNIPNRRALYDYYDSLTINNDYVLAIFDIDNFKKINDTYGHVCGDFILKEIAKIANEYFNNDFISRYGGEEFVVILNNNDYNQAIETIDKIREIIFNHPFIFEDKTINCSVTVGISKYDNEYSIDEWIMHSDNKLYEGKNKGKNITIS